MKNLQMLEQTSIIEVCMPKFVMTPLAQKQCTICFTYMYFKSEFLYLEKYIHLFFWFNL